MVLPSCPVFVVHPDDAFRKSLISALDLQHFTVTYAAGGAEAVGTLAKRTFNVVILGVNLTTSAGTEVLEPLHQSKTAAKCGVIILGDPHPDLRTTATWADETLLKPVDPHYVATRARTYCRCA
jgi:DNA-binding response OmpR family regulator